MQRSAYSRHRQKHTIEFQSLLTTNGLIAHASGPLEGRWRDWMLYIRSSFDEQLVDALLPEGRQFYIYGDSGCNRRAWMEVPIEGSEITADEKVCNKSMSKCRITVEWLFKEIKIQWTALNFRRKMKIGKSPVGSIYLAGILLRNSRNCCYPNTVSQYFSCTPSLENYVKHKD